MNGYPTCPKKVTREVDGVKKGVDCKVLLALPEEAALTGHAPTDMLCRSCGLVAIAADVVAKLRDDTGITYQPTRETPFTIKSLSSAARQALWFAATIETRGAGWAPNENSAMWPKGEGVAEAQRAGLISAAGFMQLTDEGRRVAMSLLATTAPDGLRTDASAAPKPKRTKAVVRCLGCYAEVKRAACPRCGLAKGEKPEPRQANVHVTLGKTSTAEKIR